MLNFASEDWSRLVLCGLNFDVTNERVLIVATDGRALAVLKTEGCAVYEGNPVKFNVTVDAEFLKVVAGAKPESVSVYCENCETDIDTSEHESGLLFTVESGGETEDHIISPALVTVARGEIKFQTKARDQQFPNWRKVIPTDFTQADIIISLYYLDAFRRFHDQIRCGQFMAVIRGGGTNYDNPQSAYRIHLPSLPNFFGVLMPMKWEPVEITTPTWLNL
jgi:DNA polymerase III sliding clamp (beta) subunit (PCNA family)